MECLIKFTRPKVYETKNPFLAKHLFIPPLELKVQNIQLLTLTLPPGSPILNRHIVTNMFVVTSLNVIKNV